jgi:hypothetical protein
MKKEKSGIEECIVNKWYSSFMESKSLGIYYEIIFILL